MNKMTACNVTGVACRDYKPIDSTELFNVFKLIVLVNTLYNYIINNN